LDTRKSSPFPVYFLTRTLHWTRPACVLAGLLVSSGTALAADSKPEEIQVTLFGQPCKMTGPYPKSTLSLIHEISPEKIPPTLSIDQMRKVRAKAMNLKGVTPQLETYRDHLRKRLSAKIAFEEAVQEAKKKGKGLKTLKTLLTNLKEHVTVGRFETFETEAKALFDKNAEAWNEFFINPLREKYESVIQPETEEEFHKSIRVAKIQYVCAFDEGTDENANTADEDDGE